MIIEIPEPSDYAGASINLLNLAWEIAIYTLRDWNHSEVMNPIVTPDFEIDLSDGTVEHIEGDKDPWTDGERVAAEREFWRRCQPALGNAFSLIQQAIELALKGRIAAISPFLLIVRDARDYPKNSAKTDIPFSAFRSIDAADLMRVHDTVCCERLGEAFAQFWDRIRRERNAIIHSVSPGAPVIRPERLMGTIFLVSGALHARESWFDQRMRYAMSDETHVAFRTDPKETYAKVLNEFDESIESLNPTFLERHIGLDPTAQTYLCIACRAKCDEECWHDWELGNTAQLHLTCKGPPVKETLACVLCRRETNVIRERCPNQSCGQTVLSDELGPYFRHCLSCGQEPYESEDDENDSSSDK